MNLRSFINLASFAVFTVGLAQHFPSLRKVTEAQNAANQGLPLKGWRLLKEALTEAKTNDEKNLVRGTLSQFAPFVGEIMAARQYEAEMFGKVDQLPAPKNLKIAETARSDALESIVKESKSRQIVIINEEHNSSQCRAFGMQVIQALFKVGFKTLAIETLSPLLPESVKLGYPLVNIGSYTRDPFFGDLARQSMRVGYKLVEYETRDFSAKGDSNDRINFRETDQANHLIDRVLKKDPNARIVLYVGYSHAKESREMLDDGRELIWLAARIKTMTGIDPLTIDQTTMSERASATYENMTYRFAEAKGWLKTPTMFQAKDGKWLVEGEFKDSVDMQIFHPRSIMKQGRADWMRMGGYRRDVNINPNWLPSSGEVLIQAFVASEGKQAVAMDQVIVRAGQPAPVLLVPKGKYQIQSQDDQGNIKGLGNIEVI